KWIHNKIYTKRAWKILTKLFLFTIKLLFVLALNFLFVALEFLCRPVNLPFKYTSFVKNSFVYFRNACFTLYYKFHKDSLYVTKNGVNKEPLLTIRSPIPRVTRMLKKGDRKLVKINIGTIVKNTNVKIPGIVILFSVPHMSQTIVMYVLTIDV